MAKNREERYQQVEEQLEDLKLFHKHLKTGIAFDIKNITTLPEEATTKTIFSFFQKAILKFRSKLAASFVLLGFLTLLMILFIPEGRRTIINWLGLESIPGVKHIAVLPFSNIGTNPETQAISDGLVETLTSKLTQLEQLQGTLWVVPASEMRKSQVTSAGEALKMFGVNLVVTGSVQRFGKGLRLTMNLVDAKTLRQLDSYVMDDTFTDVPVLQDQAVIKLAEMLHVQLMPETQRVLKAGGTTSPGAYEFYLQGRGLLLRYDKPENIDGAIVVFNRALQIDSNYALAYAGLGEAYLLKYKSTKNIHWIKQAAQNCQQAVELNDLIAPVHITLGLIQIETGRYKEALAEFQKALEIDPVNADAYRGRAKAFMAQGKLEEAELTYKKAIEMKPDYWGGYNDLGVFYFRHGRYEDAVPQFHHVIELTPLNAKGYRNLGSMYFYLERWKDAIKMFNRALEFRPDYSIYSNLGTLYFYEKQYASAARMYEKALELQDSDFKVWGYLAMAYRLIPTERNKASAAYLRAITLAKEKSKINPYDQAVLSSLVEYYQGLGEKDKALSLLHQLELLNPREVHILFSIGKNYEQLGKRELALIWIEKALKNGYSLKEMDHSPGLTDLRADKRFQKIIQNYRDNRK